MFTIEQIREAHSKVKSGADFPKYIQDIKKLGVTYYVVFVADGHTDFFGQDDFQISGSLKYQPLTIAEKSDIEQFKKDLKAHQQGKTDFLTFCKDCAKSGVEKWIVSLDKMTCTYYDLVGIDILVEQIPK